MVPYIIRQTIIYRDTRCLLPEFPTENELDDQQQAVFISTAGEVSSVSIAGAM